MKNIMTILGAVLTVALVNSTASASIFDDELSSDEQATVQKGKAVIHTEDVDDSAWPNVIVFQNVAATPEQVAAVFGDYDLHKVMFRDKDGSGIVESTPHFTPGKPAEADVDYVMTFPSTLGITLKPETYTSHDILTSTPDVPYQFDWQRIRSSNLIRDVKGQFRVEPLDGGSLVVYAQLISPNSSLAGMLKKKYIMTVKQSSQSLVDQVVKELSGDQATLDRQMNTLNRTLGR